MKKAVLISLLGLFITTFSSCGLLEDDKLYIGAFLEGTWNWQRSTGGIAGATIDADSVDYSMKLVIHEDAKAYMYKNNKVITEYSIKYEYQEWVWTEGPTWIFYPKKDSPIAPIAKFITELEDNRLVLQDPCYDCYTIYFTR